MLSETEIREELEIVKKAYRDHRAKTPYTPVFLATLEGKIRAFEQVLEISHEVI